MVQRYNNVHGETTNAVPYSTLFDFESNSNEMRNQQLLQQALDSCASTSAAATTCKGLITPTLDQEPDSVALELMYHPRARSRARSICGVELPNNDVDLNSSMDATTHLLNFLGQSSSPSLKQDKKSRVNLPGRFDSNDSTYNSNNNDVLADSNINYYFEPSPLDSSNEINSALLPGSSTAIITKTRRLSLLTTTTGATSSMTCDTPATLPTTTQNKQSHSCCGSRRLSLGISIEDIETILDIDTTNGGSGSSRCNSRRSSLSYSIQKPRSCENLSCFTTKTLSMHLMELSNISSSSPYYSPPIHQEKSNATFNQCKTTSSGMNDANVLLMNLFNTSNNKKNHTQDVDRTPVMNNKRNFILRPDDSTVPSSSFPSSNSHWRESTSSSTSSSNTLSQEENLFTPDYEYSSYSTFKQRQHLPTTSPPPETTSHESQKANINPLDEKSPFYSESFANEYKNSLHTLLRKMARSSQSRLGFEEVKRQLNSYELKQLEQKVQQNDPFRSFSYALQQQQQHTNYNSNWDNLTSNVHSNRLHVETNCQNSYYNNRENHSISYAAIKATRRRSSKKVEKKKQQRKFTHRRSLSLKGGCTPEMIFGY